MTKKDFEAIQEAIRDAREASAPVPMNAPYTTSEMARGVGLAQGDRAIALLVHSRIFDSLSKSIAATLAKQSGKFDRARFLAGCGVQQ